MPPSPFSSYIFAQNKIFIKSGVSIRGKILTNGGKNKVPPPLFFLSPWVIFSQNFCISIFLSPRRGGGRGVKHIIHIHPCLPGFCFIVHRAPTEKSFPLFSVLQNEKIEGEMRKLEFQRGEVTMCIIHNVQ